MSARSAFSAPAMSRVAAAGSSVGVASGALRRPLAALTCFGFSIGVFSSVLMVYGDRVARREGLVEPFVQALLEFLRRFFRWGGFDHEVPHSDPAAQRRLEPACCRLAIPALGAPGATHSVS